MQSITLCYTFVHKLHNTVKMDYKKIKTQVAAYKLKHPLFERVNILVHDGVAHSTIYKAFRVGPKTPLLQLILETAQTLVEQHQTATQQEIESLPIEAAA